MTIGNALDKIASKVDRVWADKAADLFRQIAVCDTCYTTVSNLRICKDWPHRGSITFTRDTDGKKCRLYMTKKHWKAVAK